MGVWPTTQGGIRLDGSDMTQWVSESLAQPLATCLKMFSFAGTVAQNIARFQPDWDSDDVIKAAQLAQARTLITRLPEG